MLAFKVKVTSRLRYSVSPWIGLIKGEGEGEIVVTFRLPFPEEEPAAEEWLETESARMVDDGVMICWREITQIPINEAKLAKVWETTPSRAIRCCILQCQLAKMIGLPTRVLQRRRLTETISREELVIQDYPLNVDCSNNGEKSSNCFEPQNGFSPCDQRTNFDGPVQVNEAGDSADKRSVESRKFFKTSLKRNKVSGSPSYTVAYDECHSSASPEDKCRNDASLSINDSNAKSPEPRFESTEDVSATEDFEGGSIPSWNRRWWSRVTVNSIFFASLTIALAYGKDSFFHFLSRIHQCLSVNKKPVSFLCRYTWLFCEPRDPICDFIEDWKPFHLFSSLSITLEEIIDGVKGGIMGEGGGGGGEEGAASGVAETVIGPFF